MSISYTAKKEWDRMRRNMHTLEENDPEGHGFKKCPVDYSPRYTFISRKQLNNEIDDLLNNEPRYKS